MTQTLVEMATVLVLTQIRAVPARCHRPAPTDHPRDAVRLIMPRGNAEDKGTEWREATRDAGGPAAAPFRDFATLSGDLSGMWQGPPSVVESPSDLTWADRDRLQTEMGYSLRAAVKCALSHPTPSAQGQRAGRGPAPGRLACPTTPADRMS